MPNLASQPIITTECSELTTRNAAPNEVRTALESLNQNLIELNAGRAVWFGPWEETDACQIGYAQVDGTWQLATRSCEAEPDRDPYADDGAWVAVPGSCGAAKSVLQASSAIRKHAIDLVPTIAAELKSSTTVSFESIERAMQATEPR